MTTRREFLKTASLASGVALLDLRNLWGKSLATTNFGLNEFVESRPDAVFVLRTNVDVKTNSDAIRAVGYQFGRTLFVGTPNSTNSYALDGQVVIKPNITRWTLDIPPLNWEQTMGIQTDPNFVEGLIHSLTDLGVTHENVYLREANYSGSRIDGEWYLAMAQRTGINLVEFPPIPELPETDIQWVLVPNAVWYRRIPFLVPVNSPGSCLINVSKFKSHLMGMTLCSKNLQGGTARPYVEYCQPLSVGYGVDPNDIVPNAQATILSNYTRHRDAGIPRWELPGEGTGGLWQETHASRCLDSLSVTHPLIHIVEGVYGREGSHTSGPPDNGGYGRDIMTNIIIFGKNSLHVDIIGTYLAGHEPGNFGLFHLARERGLSQYLNPRAVPLYEWHLDGTATATTVDQLPRTPIRTRYLQRPGEDPYHMVNEPYVYETGVAPRTNPDRPDAFVLSQNFPNPFNPSTSIQYHIPKSGNVRLEILDVRGRLVDVLVDAFMPGGDHLLVWDSSRRASGTYFYRLSFGGVIETRSMTLLK